MTGMASTHLRGAPICALALLLCVHCAYAIGVRKGKLTQSGLGADASRRSPTWQNEGYDARYVSSLARAEEFGHEPCLRLPPLCYRGYIRSESPFRRVPFERGNPRRSGKLGGYVACRKLHGWSALKEVTRDYAFVVRVAGEYRGVSCCRNYEPSEQDINAMRELYFKGATR